jgi:2-keto-3-deoxy-L-rhamnonate aldolase RhmA
MAGAQSAEGVVAALMPHVNQRASAHQAAFAPGYEVHGIAGQIATTHCARLAENLKTVLPDTRIDLQ